ncbi:MAG: Gfo/Idh/MocA family oxidoreductase [Nitrospiraceae bacterium]|nr:Gfo/Idh/MocA family oxidoreductase [Nitrospiraceae bacterium]
MKTHRVGVIMAGVTGRMGSNQHLARSIGAIRSQGGLQVSDGEVILPDPILVGRNEAKLKRLSAAHGGLPYTTDLDLALSDPTYAVYFDANTTQLRAPCVEKAIRAGKHIYCEKPTGTTTDGALRLYRMATAAGVKHGVVQDKLWLPGILKLRYLIDSGFFGRILSVRGEFGYWVFTGEHRPAQRPSWNYRKEDSGGLIIDMLCHWRYLVDNLFGKITAVSCLGVTAIDQRWDERGLPYKATADDSAYATFETDLAVVCHFNSSWCVRVRRDDLLTVQVDGTNGSAVAGLQDCVVQPDAMTPKPVWNPDVDNPIDFYGDWRPMPNTFESKNAFRAQWELFLRHLVLDEPFRWGLQEGAKGVQLAELGLESWKKRAWVDVPTLK